MIEKGFLRIIDANFNRCKEGLRVVEDVIRFILEDNILRKRVRRIRHSLDRLAKERVVKKAIAYRDSKRDLGRRTDVLELKRSDCFDILYINLQRAKESLRVIEEFFKISAPRHVYLVKRARYNLYSLEKEIYTSTAKKLRRTV